MWTKLLPEASGCNLMFLPEELDMVERQSLTPAPLQHFGPLKAGGGGGIGPKTTPFSEPLWYPGNIHTHAPRAATCRSIPRHPC